MRRLTIVSAHTLRGIGRAASAADALRGPSIRSARTAGASLSRRQSGTNGAPPATIRRARPPAPAARRPATTGRRAAVLGGEADIQLSSASDTSRRGSFNPCSAAHAPASASRSTRCCALRHPCRLQNTVLRARASRRARPTPAGPEVAGGITERVGEGGISVRRSVRLPLHPIGSNSAIKSHLMRLDSTIALRRLTLAHDRPRVSIVKPIFTISKLV